MVQPNMLVAQSIKTTALTAGIKHLVRFVILFTYPQLGPDLNLIANFNMNLLQGKLLCGYLCLYNV